MCGIVGYSGKRAAAPLLLQGLSRLEYRGYDSAGVALLDSQGLTVHKRAGRLQGLVAQLEGGNGFPQTVGIGHTRWATHGRPDTVNAHPHMSENGMFAVVHNGIIENYAVLRQELEASGVTFRSDTDTEVVAQLLQRYYEGDFHRAVVQTLSRLEGAYALGILCARHPEQIFCARKDSPLVIGVGEGEQFLASDIQALLPYTRRVISLADGEVARLTAAEVTVWDFQGHRIGKAAQQIEWDVMAADKGEHPHFMFKEMLEQPRALAATLTVPLEGDGQMPPSEILCKIEKIMVVACGSAYHAGLVGKYFLEGVLKMPVEVDLASEFRYRGPLVDSRTLTVAVSQSGETADTLAALREAKRRGACTLAVVNGIGSTIAEESDYTLYTQAGPEVAVATTKGYTTQVGMLYRLGLHIAAARGCLSCREHETLEKALGALTSLVEEGLSKRGEIQQMASLCKGAEHIYFIGRGTDYAVAMEAALKLKEISYIHAEAYAAGEMKHGTISLIEEGTPVVALACQPELVDKMQSNIREVAARGARVLVVTTSDCAHLFPQAQKVLTVPKGDCRLSAIPTVVPLQLLGYYVALARGCDIDKPRNLAKSVTVE